MANLLNQNFPRWFTRAFRNLAGLNHNITGDHLGKGQGLMADEPQCASQDGLEIYSANSVSEFFTHIEKALKHKLGENWGGGGWPPILFRGQTNSKYMSPLAKIHRCNAFKLGGGKQRAFSINDDAQSEKEMIRLLKLKAKAYPSELNFFPDESNDLSWNVVAAHFEMRTRLIDFSANPFVALRYATVHMGDIEATGCRDGAIVLVHLPEKLLLPSPKFECDPYAATENFWFVPAEVHPRIRHQSSYFVWQVSNGHPVRCDFGIKIPLNAERLIKPQLQKMGYGFGAVYPGIEGAVKDIDWKMKWSKWK